MNIQETKQMMIHVADGIISQVDFLTEADKMGDADHGTGMKKGFTKLKSNIENKNFDDIGSLLMLCGNSIMMSSGGASGVIFGILFKKGGEVFKNKSEMTSEDFASFLKLGLEGIIDRGGAHPNDKTMIDALNPARIAAYENRDESLYNVIKISYEAAKKGSDNTKNMVAKAGRMKTLGDRTKGFVDPGSITMYLILFYMSEYIQNIQE